MQMVFVAKIQAWRPTQGILLLVILALLALPGSVLAANDHSRCQRGNLPVEHSEPKQFCTQCHEEIGAERDYPADNLAAETFVFGNNRSFDCATCHAAQTRAGQVLDGTAERYHLLRDLVEANCATCHQSVISVATDERPGPRG